MAKIAVPEIVTEQRSADGTRKWMLRMDQVQGIETVYIPEPDRGTLCISSQVGCAMDCSFCSTAQQGFNRNLSVAEIVGQVWLAHRELTRGNGDPHRRVDHGRTITNIVFMGMGEPLANYRNVVPAMRIFMDDLGYDLSRRRVTLSTSGLVPQIYKLAEECNVALAVSLHAPNDALRNELVPINRKHPIDELLDGLLALHRQAERPQHHLRIRDARRHQRQAGACAAVGAPVARPPGETQSDPLQRVSRHALPALAGRDDPAFPRHPERSTASSPPSAARAATTSMRPADNWRAR